MTLVWYLWLCGRSPLRTALVSPAVPPVASRQTPGRVAPVPASVSPSVWLACPRGPEPSSAALQWCQAFSSSCTARGCPCIEREFSCLSSDEAHRRQSPTPTLI